MVNSVALPVHTPPITAMPLAGRKDAGHSPAMSRRRKIALAVCALVVVAATVVFWLRTKGPTYQGRTVEEWFEDLLPGSTNRLAAERTFVQLGSNAIAE